MRSDFTWTPSQTSSEQLSAHPGDLTVRSGESLGRQLPELGSHSGQSLAVSRSAKMLAGIIITAVSSSAASAAGPAYSPLWFGSSNILQYQDGDESEGRAGAELQQCFDGLVRALANEPVEDGFTHPGEDILSLAFSNFPSETADWALLAVSGAVEGPNGAATLQLLGRLKPMDENWRTRIVALALKSSDPEMRDAAVQATENWSDESLIRLLREHKEPVAWLKFYMDQIVDELDG